MSDLSVKEVADIVGVSRWSVYRAILSGRCPAYHFGGSVRVRSEDLEQIRADVFPGRKERNNDAKKSNGRNR